jgi:phage-related holin
MTVESELTQAMNEALNRGYDPHYSGILLQIINEEIHILRSNHVRLGDPRLKDLVKLVKIIRADKVNRHDL